MFIEMFFNFKYIFICFDDDGIRMPEQARYIKTRKKRNFLYERLFGLDNFDGRTLKICGLGGICVEIFICFFIILCVFVGL